MKIGSLIGIEYLKTVKRRAFWVALAFLAFLSTVALGSELMGGRRGVSAPLVAPYSWAMAAGEMGPMPAFFLALTIVMLVTSEFSWRTARQNVIDGLSKEQFFTAKWLMATMVALAFTIVPFAVATGVTIYGRVTGATPTSTLAPASAPSSAEQAATHAAFADSTRKALATVRTATDSQRVLVSRQADSTQAALRQALRDARAQRPRAVYPPPDPGAPLVSLGDLKVFAGFFLGSLGFAAMAFMLAMLLRSTGGAIGVFMLYFAFLEQMIGLLLRRFGSADLANKVVPYLPVNALRGPTNPNVWHEAHVERLNAVAASLGQARVTADADMMKLVGLPLAWIGVFVLVTFLVFRKRDL